MVIQELMLQIAAVPLVIGLNTGLLLRKGPRGLKTVTNTALAIVPVGNASCDVLAIMSSRRWWESLLLVVMISME